MKLQKGKFVCRVSGFTGKTRRIYQAPTGQYYIICRDPDGSKYRWAIGLDSTRNFINMGYITVMEGKFPE